MNILRSVGRCLINRRKKQLAIGRVHEELVNKRDWQVIKLNRMLVSNADSRRLHTCVITMKQFGTLCQQFVTINSGAVYLFSRRDNTWFQQSYIKGSNTGEGDYFGFSLAMPEDGNLLAIGAWGESSATVGVNGNQADNSAEYSGAVYLY